MRNLLALLGLAIVLFFGLGWYLGWYTLAIQAGTDGRQQVRLDVDTKKITEDAKKGLDRVEKFRDEQSRPSPDYVGPPMGPEPTKTTPTSR